MKTMMHEKLAWIWTLLTSLSFRTKQALASERGDTNFISILIILAIVMVLSGVFIGFKDQIVLKVQELINNNLNIH